MVFVICIRDGRLLDSYNLRLEYCRVVRQADIFCGNFPRVLIYGESCPSLFIYTAAVGLYNVLSCAPVFGFPIEAVPI